jgi:multicomponent Na+:H+ antiporter subunit D
MLLAMTIAAALCILIGSQPQYLYNLLPWEMDYWPYDMTHVLAQMQLLFFSALAFVWLNKQGLYPPELHSVNLDAEWLYRGLLPASAQALVRQLRQIRDRITFGTGKLLQSSRQLFGRSLLVNYHLAASWPTGSMVLWIAILLGGFLLLDSLT